MYGSLRSTPAPHDYADKDFQVLGALTPRHAEYLNSWQNGAEVVVGELPWGMGQTRFQGVSVG